MAAKKTDKSKTLIKYTHIDGEKTLSISLVDNRGVITKKITKSDKALTELKKFVNSL